MFKPEIKHKPIIINNLLRIKNIKKWLKSEILDLSHYQNFYEFPIKSLNYLVIICFDL